MTLFQKIVAATRAAIRNDAPQIALHEPCFEGNEWKYVKDCLDTGWVSSVGKYVDRFEQDLANYTGVRYAVSVVNGTAALQVCCRLAGVRPGDEVLLPALTFVATANAVHHAGGTPHFVDSGISTLGIDPGKLRRYLEETADVRKGVCFNRKTGRPIRALIGVHTYGHPVDIDPIQEICREFGLTLIEDAAESLGSRYKSRPTGTFGRIAALSFNGNKALTTGGGGAILTNDEELAVLAKHLTTTAKVKHAWEYFHDQIGYNYRLPNLNAALGCAQLEQMPKFVSRKRALAQRYFDAFREISEVKVFQEAPFAESNYWLNAFLFETPEIALRDAFLTTAHEAGLMMRPAWVLMHRLPMYESCPRMDLRGAEDIEKRLVNLPSSSQLGGSC